MEKVHKFVAWPDTHIPYHDPPSVATALKIVEWYRPETIVILGDFMDCTPVSHWLKEKKKTTEGMRLKKDFDVANKLIDKMTSYGCKHLVYLEGNHEDWIHDAIDRNPEFDGLINLEIGLKFDERRAKGLKITQLRYGKCWNLGKLWFTHGLYLNQSHAKSHVDNFGRSIVYGHTHTVQLHTKVSPMDVNDKHLGLSLGCLADKNAQYMENRPSAWVHALGVGAVRTDRTFNIDPIMISKGKATYAGRTFSS